MDRLKAEYEIGIRWRAFPLHPEIPGEGLSIADLFAGRSVDIDEVMRHLSNTAAGLGLPFGERKMTYNSRLAQELGAWAEAKGKGDAFHKVAFHAYFAGGKNIGKIPVLVELASAVDLPPEEAQAVLETRRYKEAVDRDWSLSRAQGITAVPTLVMNGDRVVGAQPYRVLEELMAAHNVPKRNRTD